MPAYPDKAPPSRANQFNQVLTSTGLVTVDFGFPMALVKFVVDSGGPAYIQFNGNPATTLSYPLTSGDFLTDWYDFGIQVSGVSIATTSTGLNMRVGAWG